MSYSAQTILWLLETPGIGRGTVHRMLTLTLPEPATPEDLQAALQCTKAQYARTRIPKISEIAAARDSALRVMDESERRGIALLATTQPNFPDHLRSIPDPPVLLHVLGSLDWIPSRPAIAIVGTRSPSRSGLRWAMATARLLAKMGVPVISGLAEGCDTAAHRGSLRGNGVTIAVLAHGLDSLFPPSNRDLARKIVAAGGALVSEYAVGASTRRQQFVERDRLQSGLSDAVIVVETGVKGGTMHTVKACRAQARRLACLRPNPETHGLASTGGVQMLLDAGEALPLETRADVEALVAALDASHPTTHSSRPPGRPIQQELGFDAL